MTHKLISTLSLVACGLATFAALGFAQDPFGGPDPFGGTPATTTTEPTPADAAPGAAAGPAKPPTADNETDPVVLSIRRSNPTTPTDLMLAIRDLTNLGRPDEAKKYITQLLSSAPSPEILAGFHRQIGASFFLRLIRDERFAPEGLQLGDTVLQAAAQQARDPARLAALITQLSDPAPEARYAAVVDLRSGGLDAVVALISVLADDSRAAERRTIRGALLQLGEVSVEPLMGALETKNPVLLANVVDTLGRLDATRAVPFLVAPYLSDSHSPEVRKVVENALRRLVKAVPGRGEAEALLYQQTRQYMQGKLAGRPDHEDMVTVWRWDEAKHLSYPERYASRLASSLIASRLADDLHTLAPNNADYLQVYLITQLEADKTTQGLDQPLPRGAETAHEACAAAGPAALLGVLDQALEGNRFIAAAAVLEVLGDVGNVTMLQSAGGALSPIAAALRHSDRRVRFAAAEAVMRFAPTQPYAGASFLPETLGFLASAAGRRRVLVAHPRIDQSQTLVALLGEAGFDAETAQTGREALILATRNPDFEFLLLSDAINAPAVAELIQLFRQEPRTAGLPIGVFSRQERLQEMERLTEYDPLAEAFPRPHEAGTMAIAARRLLDRAGNNIMSHEERLRQAAVALDHLATLAAQPDKFAFYDLLSQQSLVEKAFNSSPLMDRAAKVLGLLGSSSAQQRLVSLASQNALPLNERTAAAAAFQIAVDQRGLLLDTDEILLQYDRYNQSATLDVETQKVLASILDTIEAPIRPATPAAAPSNAASPEPAATEPVPAEAIAPGVDNPRENP